VGGPRAQEGPKDPAAPTRREGPAEPERAEPPGSRSAGASGEPGSAARCPRPAGPAHRDGSAPAGSGARAGLRPERGRDPTRRHNGGSWTPDQRRWCRTEGRSFDSNVPAACRSSGAGLDRPLHGSRRPRPPSERIDQEQPGRIEHELRKDRARARVARAASSPSLPTPCRRRARRSASAAQVRPGTSRSPPGRPRDRSARAATR
jgi:hypothetical protein